MQEATLLSLGWRSFVNCDLLLFLFANTGIEKSRETNKPFARQRMRWRPLWNRLSLPVVSGALQEHRLFFFQLRFHPHRRSEQRVSDRQSAQSIRNRQHTHEQQADANMRDQGSPFILQVPQFPARLSLQLTL